MKVAGGFSPKRVKSKLHRLFLDTFAELEEIFQLNSKDVRNFEAGIG